VTDRFVDVIANKEDQVDVVAIEQRAPRVEPAAGEVLAGGERDADGDVGVGRWRRPGASDGGGDAAGDEAIPIRRACGEAGDIEADGAVAVGRHVGLARGDDVAELLVGRDLVAEAVGALDAGPEEDAVRGGIARGDALGKHGFERIVVRAAAAEAPGRERGCGRGDAEECAAIQVIHAMT
jgi:hypothetical protein